MSAAAMDSAIVRRFMSNVDVLGECWSWIRSRSSGGYGSMSLVGTTYPAHVISYSIFNGPVPSGMFVCHHCDNPPGRHSSSPRRVRVPSSPQPAAGVLGHLAPGGDRAVDSDKALLAIMRAAPLPLLLHQIASHPHWTWTRRTASSGLTRLARRGLVAKDGDRWYPTTA